MMGTTSSTIVQSLGRSNNARRLQVRKCGVCHYFLSVTLLVRSAVRSRVHSSKTHCVAVYRPISTRFTAFSISDSSFRHATQYSHSLLGGATIVAKFRSKIAKSPKIGGKVCAHHFVQIAEGFEKDSTAVVYGRDCRCAPIYIFSACRYLALTASIKVRISSPKTARNQQVCAHQKSYRK